MPKDFKFLLIYNKLVSVLIIKFQNSILKTVQIWTFLLIVIGKMRVKFATKYLINELIVNINSVKLMRSNTELVQNSATKQY